jgi:SMC interacting uncharacterized protein involved in chromosome segregation
MSELMQKMDKMAVDSEEGKGATKRYEKLKEEFDELEKQFETLTSQLSEQQQIHQVRFKQILSLFLVAHSSFGLHRTMRTS